MEIGENMQTMGQSKPVGPAQFHDARDNALMHCRIRLTTGSVPADDMVKQRPGGRLPTFVEPTARKDRAEIGPPHPGHRPCLLRQRHDTAGCAGNEGEVTVDAFKAAGKSAENAKRAGMSVDEADTGAASG